MRRSNCMSQCNDYLTGRNVSMLIINCVIDLIEISSHRARGKCGVRFLSKAVVSVEARIMWYDIGSRISINIPYIYIFILTLQFLSSELLLIAVIVEVLTLYTIQIALPTNSGNIELFSKQNIVSSKHRVNHCSMQQTTFWCTVHVTHICVAGIQYEPTRIKM